MRLAQRRPPRRQCAICCGPLNICGGRPPLCGIHRIEAAARKAKTHVVVAHPGATPTTGRCPGAPRIVGESAAAKHAVVAVARGIQQIPAPFPHIAQHVEGAVQVGHLAADRLWRRHAIERRPRDFRQRTVMGARRSGSASELPFSLRRQTIALSINVPRNILTVEGVGRIKPLPFGGCIAESDGAQPAHIPSRATRAGVCLAKELAELLLSYGKDADLEGFEFDAPAPLAAGIMERDHPAGNARHLKIFGHRCKCATASARESPTHQCEGRSVSTVSARSDHTTREPPDMINLTLNNGVTMPALGLGVYQSAPAETADAVETALRIGYRHIDTAAAYLNEREVGEGIRRSEVPRDDVFIETKVWVSDYGYDSTLHAFEKSVGKLGVDTLDLLILHQPVPNRFDTVIAAYKALEALLADGRVRSIGVSNFMPHHLERLMQETEVVPALNQIELHPYFSQPEAQRADAAHGILTQAWSPSGGITFYPRAGAERVSVMEDPTIHDIAASHGKTPAQVMLRWHLQEGRSVIPKSVTASRIAENFDVFDFALTAEQLRQIDGLDRGVRGGPDPDQPPAGFFDFVIPEA